MNAKGRENSRTTNMRTDDEIVKRIEEIRKRDWMGTE